MGDDWLDVDVPIDPLLREPLELYGGHCRRRIQVVAWMRALGFDEYRDMAPSTHQLLFGMLAEVAEALDRRRVDVRARAVEVVSGGGRLDGALVARAMIDLGWGHHELPAGSVRDTLAAVESVFVRLMADRVVQVFRRWEKRGWLSDVAA